MNAAVISFKEALDNIAPVLFQMNWVYFTVQGPANYNNNFDTLVSNKFRLGAINLPIIRQACECYNQQQQVPMFAPAA